MNSTNRVLNRLLLLVVGILLLVAGAARVVVAVLPGWATAWHGRAAGWNSLLDHAPQLDLTRLGMPQPVPWFLIAVPAAALVLVVLLLIFVFAQGRGHVGRIADGWPVASAPADGLLSVDVGLARDAIRRSTRDIRGLSEPGVNVYRVRGKAALRITAPIAAGVDPASLLPRLESALQEWDELLGGRCPACIHLTAAGTASSGFAPGAARREPSLVQ